MVESWWQMLKEDEYNPEYAFDYYGTNPSGKHFGIGSYTDPNDASQRISTPFYQRSGSGGAGGGGEDAQAGDWGPFYGFDTQGGNFSGYLPSGQFTTSGPGYQIKPSGSEETGHMIEGFDKNIHRYGTQDVRGLGKWMDENLDATRFGENQWVDDASMNKWLHEQGATLHDVAQPFVQDKPGGIPWKRSGEPMDLAWRLLKQQSTLDQWTERGIMGDLPPPHLWHISRAPVGTLIEEGLRTDATGYGRGRGGRWRGASPIPDPYEAQGPYHSTHPVTGESLKDLEYQRDWYIKPDDMGSEGWSDYLKERREKDRMLRGLQASADKKWWGGVKDTGATFVMQGPDAREQAATWLSPKKEHTMVGIRPKMGPEGEGQFTMNQPTVDLQEQVRGEGQVYEDIPPERLMFAPQVGQEYERGWAARNKYLEGLGEYDNTWNLV